MKRLILILCVISLLLSVLSIGAASSSAATAAKHTITFDTLGIGETPDPITVEHGQKYLYLRENNTGNPTADGYVFHCWVTTTDYEPDEVAMSNTAAYLETPVTEDMTLYAVWYKLIDEIEVSVDEPVPGDEIEFRTYYNEGADYDSTYQYPRPNVTVYTEGVKADRTFLLDLPNSYWLYDPNDPESEFSGVFQDGKRYGVSVCVRPEFGYEFSKDLNVTLNGNPVTLLYPWHDLCTFSAYIPCGDGWEDLPEGDDDDPDYPATDDQRPISSYDEASPDSVDVVPGGIPYHIMPKNVEVVTKKPEGRASSTYDSPQPDNIADGEKTHSVPQKAAADTGAIPTGAVYPYVILLSMVLSAMLCAYFRLKTTKK